MLLENLRVLLGNIHITIVACQLAQRPLEMKWGGVFLVWVNYSGDIMALCVGQYYETLQCTNF